MGLKYNIDIEDRILDYLDGWVTESPRRRDESALLLTENKIIPSAEVEEYFYKACNKIATYLYLKPEEIPHDERIIEEICQYTAGLLFKRYNITPNDNFEDSTPLYGFGNYLLQTALENLKPFRNSTFSMWVLR